MYNTSPGSAYGTSGGGWNSYGPATSRAPTGGGGGCGADSLVDAAGSCHGMGCQGWCRGRKF